MVGLEWILFGLRLLAALVLYTFLGVAFYIIWQDLKQAGKAEAAAAQNRLQLRVLAANGDSGLGVGQTMPLQPVTVLGRDPGSTVTVTDTAAAGRHARIQRVNGTWWLEDLNSGSGTLLNDLPLSAPASLADGDIIGIGRVRFKVEVG